MTTTDTTTPTVTLTMADRHRIAADLYAWNGLGDVISTMRINQNEHVEAQLWSLDPTVEGRALQVARDMLDDPTVQINQREDSDYASIHVILQGHYRGVSMTVVSVVQDQAARDLIRDLAADRVIDALAGDDSREG